MMHEFKEQYFSQFQIEDTDWSNLVSSFKRREYFKKGFLLRAGELWNRTFYIEQGVVRLFYTDLEGRDFNKAFFEEQHCIWPVNALTTSREKVKIRERQESIRRRQESIKRLVFLFIGCHQSIRQAAFILWGFRC